MSPVDLTPEQREELQTLVAESELYPERKLARLTELMLLQRFARLCRRFQSRLPLAVQQQLVRLPRRPNPAEWVPAEPERDELELKP